MKPCAGCLESDQGKPEHCRKCRIKDCVAKHQITYCFECPGYPCKQIKQLEKSYNARYHASLMANSQMVKKQGIAEFLTQQKEDDTCPECGGILSLQDAACSECRMQMKNLKNTRRR